jgi:hypothetical protein
MDDTPWGTLITPWINWRTLFGWQFQCWGGESREGFSPDRFDRWTELASFLELIVEATGYRLRCRSIGGLRRWEVATRKSAKSSVEYFRSS